MTPRRRRLVVLLGAGGLFCAGVSLILVSLQDNLLYFVSPTQVLQQTSHNQKRVRLGGLVSVGSIVRQGFMLHFTVTDGAAHVPVHYNGLVPDLFREDQGVVVEGHMVDSIFMADTLLAKHDERYMPSEVVQSLKDQGRWRP